MRRRRHRRVQGGGNLDSLLDTMTNVVGILVIVLIMTQVNVADAVRRLRSGLPEVSPEQMEQLQQEVKQADTEIALLSSPDGAFDPAKLASTKAQVGVLKVEIDKEKSKAKPKSELMQLIADRKKALEKAEAAKTSMEEKLGGLRSELDEAKALAARPPVRVRLPNPRPAREEATRALFACIGDKVYVIDENALMGKAKAALAGGGRGLVHAVEGSGAKKVTIYKRKESESHIGKGKVGDSFMTVELRTYPDRGYGTLILVPRPDGGEAVSSVRVSDRGAVRQLMQKTFLARDYAYFLVAPDAFATYLEARRIAEVDHNLAVGWEFTNTDLKSYKGLSGVRFEHTPPPPPDPTKPKPKPNPKPPGRPNVLD